ncbi:MAG: caspase family protein [Bacteroidia bacterium]|nr:caspase family protein [Bacteroidia bacterium]
MSSNGHVKLPFNLSHAFIIGINDYQHLTPLKTAVNDAKGLAERLEAQHEYIIHGPYLDATREELEKLFRETMPALVKKEDRVLFYFAGHGIALDGEEGPNGYIVPKDAKQGDRDSLLPMNLLHDSINALPCQHGMLILDCCFSGAFKWSTGFRDVMFDLPKIIYEERFWRYVKDPAWQVITSSAYDQKAVDVISNQSIGMREEGEGIHSPFAKALFEAIDGAGDVIPADQGDGVITASELYAYLRDAVESKTNEQAIRQSPSMFNLGRHDKGEFIFLNPRHRFNLPPTPDRNPFMGLASYDEADSNFFFGRDRVIEALIEKVKTNPLTVVSGASGTGKSSVIKAGLLPELRKEGWRLHKVIRPGKEPMQELKKEIGDLEKEINSEEQSLLIVDQYEELITQCLDPGERNDFEEQIAKWIEKHPNLHVILSVRSDFEPQFESENLGKWWQAGRYVVPSFSLDEIREIITKPALQAILFYEPLELVDRLEEDISQAPGALPLLSFTLSELYYAYLSSGRQDRSLSIEDYEEMGGLIGALRTKADEVYLNLDTEHQDTMRKLMLRMVSLEGGELARKRVYSTELFFEEDVENHRIESISQQMINARLLVKGSDTQGKTYLEPAHDALVRAWARLWEWIKAIGEEKLIWQNKLSQAVEDYQEQLRNDSGKEKQYLWNNNPRLDILVDEIKLGSHTYNKEEKTFILKSADRKKSRRNILIWSLVGVIALVSTLGLVANEQRKEAVRQEQIANDSTLAAQEQRTIAEAKTEEAQMHADSADARLARVLSEKERGDFENTRNVSWLNALRAEEAIDAENLDVAYSFAWKAFESQKNERVGEAMRYVSAMSHRDLVESDIIDLKLDQNWYEDDLKFSPSGKYFSLDRTESVDIWQWKPLKFLFKAQAKSSGSSQTNYGFSPQEDAFLFVDLKNKKKQAWELTSGKEVKTSFSPFALAGLFSSSDVHRNGDDYWLIYPANYSANKFVLVSWNRLRAADANQQGDIKNLIDTEAEWVEKLIELDFEAEKAFFSEKGEEIYFTESGKGNYFHKVNIQDPAKTQRFGPHDLSIEFISEIPEMDFLTAMNNSGGLYGYRLSSSEIVDSVNTYYADVMHPNGRQLIGASNANDRSRRLGKLWNIDIALQFSIALDLKKTVPINWVKLSPKSNYLAYCVADTSWVKTLYSPSAPRMLTTKRKYGEFFNFTFSNNEKYLIAFKGRDSEKTIQTVHEVSSGRKLYEINGLHSLVFSADSKKLIELEADGKAYEREINGGAKGKLLFDAGKNFARMYISPGGKYMVLIGGENTKKSVLWNHENGRFIELEADYEQISFSRDEKFILAKLSNRMVHIINSKDMTIQKVENLAGMSPISIIGAETEMMLLKGNQYLLTSNGVYHINSGLKIESFHSNYHQKRTKPSHSALDPMGRWKLSYTGPGRLQKTPIYARDWLDGKIYQYKELEAKR